MRWMMVLAAVVLVAHGLIHLIGTTVYLRLAEIEGFAYKTTLLGGRWDLGAAGIGVFGALWAVATVGFIVAAVGMLANSSWWKTVLIAVTVYSLILTALDSSLAFAGIGLNIVILIVVFWMRRSSGERARQKGT